MSHYDPIAFSSVRACYDDDSDDDGADGDNSHNNDALFLTSNYLASQNMMLYFNRIFSEQNKAPLLFLSTIRTILSTAVRPIVDLFVLNADEKQQDANNKRRRRHFAKFECAPKRNIQQKLITIDVDGKGSSEDLKFNNLNINLRQKRLNIDVFIKQ